MVPAHDDEAVRHIDLASWGAELAHYTKSPIESWCGTGSEAQARILLGESDLPGAQFKHV